MKKFIHTTLFFLCWSVLATVNAEADPSREDREISMAKDEVFFSLILTLGSSNTDSNVNGFYDFRSSAAEMGLALIASKNSNLGNKTLLTLLQFRMDGELSEDFDCYAMQKGKRLLSQIKDLNAAQLVGSCQASVRDTVEKNSKYFDLEKSYRVCSSNSEIIAKMAELKSAINKNRKCSSGDF
jgi:hypothetical protein